MTRGTGGRTAAPSVAVAPRGEECGELQADDGDSEDADPGQVMPSSPIDSDDEAVVAGTLRSPWKWEELIVESAVVGGRSREDGKARWRRRLDGLAADYQYRIDELDREEPESPRMARFVRDVRNLSHLRQFALPIIDELAAWPERATWGLWLDRFSALAVRALRRPERVLRMLAELRPMAEVGPVTIEETRDVLHDRLVALDWEPPARRYLRLFVGTRTSPGPQLPIRLVPVWPSGPCRSGRGRSTFAAIAARRSTRSSSARTTGARERCLDIAIGRQASGSTFLSPLAG